MILALEVNHGVCLSAKPLRLQNMERRFRLRIEEMSSKGGLRAPWPSSVGHLIQSFRESRCKSALFLEARLEDWKGGRERKREPGIGQGLVWLVCMVRR